MSSADALSALRALLALPAYFAIAAGAWGAAAGIFVVAVASDGLDGPLARSRGTARPRGALLDHGADALFVAIALAAHTHHGSVPVLLPVLVLLAFAQYVWDSGAHRGGELRGNTIGRINGIAYYALAGALIAAEGWIPSALDILAGVSLGLIGTTAFSMSQRLRLRRRT